MGRTIELATGSPEETKAVGAAVGSLLGSGDVVSLTGDLGAGKTTFVQGAAEALQVKDPVLSPTFTLIREYQGTFRVYHLDVYRLDRLQDVLDLGIDEQHRVSKQEARSADEVQRLVDTAVVIEAMVIPALGSQFLQEVLDHSLPPNSFGFVFIGIRCPACDIMMLTCDGL